MIKMKNNQLYIITTIMLLLCNMIYIKYAINSNIIQEGIDWPAYSQMRINYMQNHNITRSILLGIHEKYFITGLYYMLFTNNNIAAIVLTLFSFLSWFYFSIVSVSFLKNETLKNILFIVILSGCINPNIFFYNFYLSSDGLSISSTLIVLAGILSIYKSVTKYNAFIIIIFTFLSAYIRTTNAFLIPFILLIMFLNKNRLIYKLFIYAISLILCVSSLFIMSKFTRILLDQSTTNNVYNRILTDNKAKEYFIMNGMPNTVQLNNCIRKKAWKCDAGDKAQYWINRYGQNIYMKWLILTLPKRLENILLSCPILIHDTSIIYSSIDNPIIIKILSRLIPLGNFRLIYILIFLVVTSGITLYKMKKITNNILSIYFLLMAIMPNIFICYYGDTDQISRHILVPFIFLEVLLLIVVFLSAEIILFSNKLDLDIRASDADNLSSIQ